MKHLASVCCFALLWSLLLATPALAEAPSNDTYTGRTIIAELPYTDEVPLGEATADAGDDELFAVCTPAEPTVASVWYEYTATNAQRLRVHVADITGNGTLGAIVATGAPGAFELVACGLGASDAIFTAVTGETFAIMAFHEGSLGEPGDPPVTLRIDVVEVVPPPDVTVTLDPTGTFDPTTGQATFSATAVCSGAPASLVSVQGFIEQERGRTLVTQSIGWIIFGCEDEVFAIQDWMSVPHAPSPGPLRGGPTVISVTVNACGLHFNCSGQAWQQTVRLHAQR